jgi:hypothetical protein
MATAAPAVLPIASDEEREILLDALFSWSQRKVPTGTALTEAMYRRERAIAGDLYERVRDRVPA